MNLQRTKEDISTLELEFQAIVRCPLWVLRTELHPLKEKQESILNHWAKPEKKKRKFLANPVVGNKYRCSWKQNFLTHSCICESLRIIFMLNKSWVLGGRHLKLSCHSAATGRDIAPDVIFTSSVRGRDPASHCHLHQLSELHWPQCRPNRDFWLWYGNVFLA